MLNSRTITLFCFFVLFAAVVMGSEKCVDELGSHCDVFSSFCFEPKWADIKAKCARTCGVCTL